MQSAGPLRDAAGNLVNGAADAINWANDYIQEVCIDTGAYFCDVAHDMRDSTSVLESSYASSNGKTLNTAGLNAFLQYLRTHMVEG